MQYLDEVRLISDKYESKGYSKGARGAIIFAEMRYNTFLVEFFGIPDNDDPFLPIHVADLELVRSAGITDEQLLDEFDKEKSKVMNYIMYKKRTEYEVRNKFSKTLEENLLDDIIEYIKDAGYLSDTEYIKRAVSEFQALNNLSRKEIKYKLYSKGVGNSLIEDYFSEKSEELYEYELKSARNIFIKKQSTIDEEEIRNYLRKKGYREDIIKQAIEDEE